MNDTTRNVLTALDIRSFLLGNANSPMTFTTKRDALAEAKRRGFSSQDLYRAANRFQAFWIIGQPIGDSRYRVVCNDGQIRETSLSYRCF